MSTPSPSTLGELLAAGRRALAAAPHRPARREAALLLGHVLGRDEASVLAHDDVRVSARDERRFRGLLERRLSGEPVAYLLGEREFFGRPFVVDSRVLIPRPETEHLIEAVLALDLPAAPRLIDVGTGSGCLAATLALELPRSQVWATDLSPAALAVASANVARHGIGDRVALVGCDLLQALRVASIDAVVSNPPYVDPADRRAVSPEVRGFEPHGALFAEERGRRVIARLLAEAAVLRPGAHLVLEIGYDQSEWLSRTVADDGAWELLDVIRDYGSIPRTAVLRRSP